MWESKSDAGFGEEGAQVVDLVPWARALHRARRTHRAFGPTGDSQPHSLAENDATIASAGPLEAYYAVKRRGLGEAIPVLGVLTGEQIQTLFDLELWKSDCLEIPDLLSWLEGFRIAGQSALVRSARALDPEALAVLFRRRLFIALTPKVDRSEESPIPDWLENPPEGIEPILQTPDGRFLIAARTVDERSELEGSREEIDEEERKQVLALVRELYLDEDWETTAGVLRLALEDLSSSLEEDAFRFRNARVEDFGFPSRSRALEIYGPLDPSILERPSTPYPVLENARLPLMHAETLSQGLLDETLRRLEGRITDRVEGDLLAVSNRVLVADAVDAGDLDGLQSSLERTRAYIELGLSHGVAPAERSDIAAGRLVEHHPEILFRVGYTATLRAASRARTLAAHPALGDAGILAWSESERGVFEALLERRPMFPAALESWDTTGGPPAHSGTDPVRPFRRPEDLERVDRFLDERDQLLDALTSMQVFQVEIPEGTLPTDNAERDIDVRLATLGARVLLGDGLRFDPLDAAALVALADHLGTLSEPTTFEPAALETAWMRLRLELPPAASGAFRRRVTAALETLADTLFPLVGQDRIDPRFVTGVLRRS